MPASASYDSSNLSRLDASTRNTITSAIGNTTSCDQVSIHLRSQECAKEGAIEGVAGRTHFDEVVAPQWPSALVSAQVERPEGDAAQLHVLLICDSGGG
jgi:hypothetical protein